MPSLPYSMSERSRLVREEAGEKASSSDVLIEPVSSLPVPHLTNHACPFDLFSMQ